MQGGKSILMMQTSCRAYLTFIGRAQEEIDLCLPYPPCGGKIRECNNIRSDTRFGEIHAHDQFAKVAKMRGAGVCNKTSNGVRTC